MEKKRKNDGLNKWQRYRLKDLNSYRARKAAAARTPEMREKRRLYMQLWRDKNRDKYNNWARTQHHKHRAKYNASNRNRYYVKKYGITSKERDELVGLGSCGICKKRAGLHVDHDHSTKGTYRGLLCMTCNTHLGWVETVSLAKIEKYLAVRQLDTVW